MAVQRKTKLVHIVGLQPLQRFQVEFDLTDTSEQILSQLQDVKRMFGFVGSTKAVDTISGRHIQTRHGDPKSGFLLDHPQTVVSIGHMDEGTGAFVEETRIQGPKDRDI